MERRVAHIISGCAANFLQKKKYKKYLKKKIQKIFLAKKKNTKNI
jgi:hypothetical protein